MDILEFFKWLNNDVFAIPATLLFFGTAIVLTLKTGFLQFRGIPRFLHIIFHGIKSRKTTQQSGAINAFHALFAAMATTIGMGNVVGPSIAIMTGGPGALFWLILYMFFASATKFTEVVFALHTREKMPDGYIVGGPMQYLRVVHPFLANWYGIVMTFLFIYWSSAQANTLASIFALENVPTWIVGLALALFVLGVVTGGAKRVGAFASKLVPIMFILYVLFALLILFKEPKAFYNALILIKQNIFSPAAAMGGFLGATVFQAMHAGIYRAIYISESGLGVSSIPHSMADTQRPTDQGLLAMFSAVADITLSLISGFLVLVSGVWIQGAFRATLPYEAFKMHSPGVGQLVLLITISLFVLTTVIGNSFNGIQSFTSFTKHRFVKLYILFSVFCIFLGSLMPVSLVWAIMDTLLTLAAIPNLVGILILAFKKPQVLKG